VILVAGATGFLGREICRRLVAAGHGVRALVRPTSDPTARDALRDFGARIVEGDLRDRASLDAACRDASVVVSTATTTRTRQPGDSIEATDRDGQLNLVEAARDAGVERFVFVSYSGQIPEADPLTRAKRTVERRLRESGMTYTILRPSIFMDVWLSPFMGFDYPNARATVYGTGENPISWVSLGDVAEVAARSVDDRAAANAVIEFGGPEPLSPLDAVRVFEEATGRRFEVQLVPEEALEAQRGAATNSLEEAFAALMLRYAAGDAHDNAALRSFGMRLRSLRDYAAECARQPAAVPATA
jgi:NADH dehydrogenase